MARIFKIVFSFVPLLALSGCMAVPTNDAAFDALWNALQNKDRSVRPTVQMVLEDALHHRDRFNHETRKTAFEVLRVTNMTELLPLIRQVAAMDYRVSGETGGDLYDVVAIQQALVTLREWRDSSTIELSLRRLTADSWLQTTAVNNLRRLGYWQATASVQQLLGNIPKNLDHLVVISELMDYLWASPKTDSGVCDSLTSLQTSFPLCFQDDRERWRCGELAEDTRRLWSRLGCIGDMGH